MHWSVTSIRLITELIFLVLGAFREKPYLGLNCMLRDGIFTHRRHKLHKTGKKLNVNDQIKKFAIFVIFRLQNSLALGQVIWENLHVHRQKSPELDKFGIVIRRF